MKIGEAQDKELVIQQKNADQDSDFLYCTNQKEIVEHARNCYANYPTIVNNIPKEKNFYDNTMDDFAKLDNLLSASQTDIGESSNLAQIAQTYSYNFSDEKYEDYVCIMSVLAQVAIDSAKRRFDVNIPAEISRIKADMDIKEIGYPLFWSIIKKGFNRKHINPELDCPMNYLYSLQLEQGRTTKTISISNFFNVYPVESGRRKCRKVEELIENYSLELYKHNTDEKENDRDGYFLLRSDFDKMVQDIRQIHISKNYICLMSWLINRAFCITPGEKKNIYNIQTKLDKNKSLLLKVLYDVNPSNLLEIFSKNVKK